MPVVCLIKQSNPFHSNNNCLTFQRCPPSWLIHWLGQTEMPHSQNNWRMKKVLLRKWASQCQEAGAWECGVGKRMKDKQKQGKGGHEHGQVVCSWVWATIPRRGCVLHSNFVWFGSLIESKACDGCVRYFYYIRALITHSKNMCSCILAFLQSPTSRRTVNCRNWHFGRRKPLHINILLLFAVNHGRLLHAVYPIFIRSAFFRHEHWTGSLVTPCHHSGLC